MVGVLEEFSESIRILHLDDDRDVTNLTAAFLERKSEEFEVVTENSPTEALDRIRTEDVDGIVCDYDMHEMDGLEFLEAVREEYMDLPFILFTGKGSEEIASEAISRGVTDYLQKGSGSDKYTVLANRIQNAVAQYRAEREVEQRSKWYSRILEHSSDYVMIVNEMGKVSYVSPAIERVMGYTPEEIVGTNSFDNIHPDDLEHAADALAQTIEHPDQEVTVEFRAEADDGSIRWLEARGSNFLDDSLINGVMVNVRDVTERKERERELRRQQAFLEQSMDIIVVLEGEGTVDYVSSSIEQVLGYQPEELIGTNVFDLVHPADRNDTVSMFEDLTSEPGGQERAEFRISTATGEWCWLEVQGTNQLADPVIDGVVVNARDITERKERQREIQRQNERLDEFASVVSHDLRNPLNVAKGQLELARDECDTDHLDGVRRAHERMNELIDNLLVLARSGEQVRDVEPVDLEALTENCWDNVDTFDATFTVETKRMFRADPSRLRQLVENLFRNAVEHGGRDVTVTVGDLDDQSGFYVEDDGSGIADEDREQVFESGYSTTEHGTGFGLSIVKQVANAHGWDVQVTDGAEGGARFEFSHVEGTE